MQNKKISNKIIFISLTFLTFLLYWYGKEIANYLDKIGRKKEANFVDALIATASDDDNVFNILEFMPKNKRYDREERIKRHNEQVEKRQKTRDIIRGFRKAIVSLFTSTMFRAWHD